MLKVQNNILLACQIMFLLALSQSVTAGGDLRASAQNPISSMVSLPLKLTADQGAKNGNGTTLNINPVIPVTVGDWNFVNRALIPLGHVDGAIVNANNPNPKGGKSSAGGLGDINYSLFISPVKYDKVIWGVGPSINLPTASDDQLGSGKWSAGPTAVALTLPKWGSMGILGRQLWSFAGSSRRDDVNQTLIEPFINYNLSDGWYLITDMVITANWEAKSKNTWTIPVGGGVGKLFKIGDQAVNAKLETYYNAEKPEGAPNYSVSFQFQFLFPK